MYKVFKNRFYLKAVAALLTNLMVVQCFLPTAVYALTSGPSQPEFASFSPAGVNNLVDPFTGDFSYNIDLMTIPGFEDGYPLNLSYNADITAEQEASWVGLGWNLNIGAVTRQMRGIPDDFNGDKITKHRYEKPTRTISVGTPVPPAEAFGKNLNKVAPTGMFKMYYNTQTGAGLSYGISFAAGNFSTQKGRFNAGINLGLNYDTQTGFGVSPSVSFSGKSDEVKKSVFHGVSGSLSASFSSREGLEDISFASNVTTASSKGNYLLGQLLNNTLNGSFAAKAPVPTIDYPRGGLSLSLRAKAGTALIGNTQDIDTDFAYSNTSLAKNKIDLAGLGFMYAHARNDQSNVLMDYHREKDAPVTENTNTIPITIADYDVFSVQAQGLSGTVRGVRGDHGVFTPPTFKSNMLHIGAGVEANPEVNLPPGIKTGTNVTVSNSSNYSGPWTDGKGDLMDHFGFVSKVGNMSSGIIDHPAYEPIAFVDINEPVANYESNYANTAKESEEAIYFRVKEKAGIKGFEMRIKNEVESSVGSRANFNNYEKRRTARLRRLTDYQFPTYKDLGLSVPTHAKAHHIAKVVATQQGGKKYEFGKPLYNISQVDVAFSVSHKYNEANDKDLAGLVNYSSAENSTSNKSGRDNLYSKTTLPPYAHSYLLTKIKGANYVDVNKNDELDETDFGDYVKFNYLLLNELGWRSPTGDQVANYAAGLLSFPGDDKASYTYGKKQITFPEEIETRTHKVVFTYEDRKDALGYNENGTLDTSTKKKALKKLTLYKKAFSGSLIEIKAAHFEYTYELCKKIPNITSTNTEKGKLTLKKVWFSYRGNESPNAKLACYTFEYPDNDRNPDYDPDMVDRWGYLQKKRFDGLTNKIMKNQPYTYQYYTEEERSEIASYWKIKTIKTPSGGEIKVEYEMDSYSHVQHKQAMQMMKVVGFGSSNTENKKYLKKSTRYIVARIPKANLTINDVTPYVKGVDKVYFNVFMRLKKLPVGGEGKYQGLSTIHDGYAYDYVSGYADYDNEITVVGTGTDYTDVSIKLKSVNLSKIGSDKSFPIRKAGFQHLKRNRLDLLGTPIEIPTLNNPMALLAPLTVLTGAITSALDLIMGFERMASFLYCKEVKVDDVNHPSYIRLNAVGEKFGGGYRVKRIELSDKWSTLSGVGSTKSYGQEYIYKNNDGSSSGVASYEPLIGGEENPFKRPLYQKTGDIFVRDQGLFVEEPLCESFYQAARVGYSQVVVRSLENDAALNPKVKGGSGVTVHEFYTAKEFPTKVKRTSLGATEDKKFIFIPFLGSHSVSNSGYSQGFSVELNDMHGKPKATTTYRHFHIDEQASQLSDIPNKKVVTREETHYFLDGYNQVIPGGKHELKATVSVMNGSDEPKKMELGKLVETYSSMNENKTTSVSANSLFNLQIFTVILPTGPFLVVAPTSIPDLETARGIYRDISTTKVINKLAIPKKKVVYDGASKVVYQNLHFDKESGQPIITRHNNEFGDPVYTYNRPAHYFYDDLKGTYENIGVEVMASDMMASASAQYFKKGDRLAYFPSYGATSTNTKLWVHNTDPLQLKDETGTVHNIPTSQPTAFYKVIESGNQNAVSAMVGKTVSLADPLLAEMLSQGCAPASGFHSDSTYLNVQFIKDLFSNGIQFYDPPSPLYYQNEYNYNDVYHQLRVNSSIYSSLNLGGVYNQSNIPVEPYNYTNQSNKLYILKDGTTLVFYIHASEIFSVLNFFPDNCGNCFVQGEVEFPSSYSNNSIVGFYPSEEMLNQFSEFNSFYGGQITGYGAKSMNYSGRCNYSFSVLHADNTTYHDDVTIDFEEYLKTTQDVSTFNSVVNKINGNEYAYGKRGMFIPSEPYVYRIKRTGASVEGSSYTKTWKDGEYEKFRLYDFASNPLPETNENWIPKGELTLISPDKKQLESKNPLGIYSSAMYGYKNRLNTAVAQNAKYAEIAFDGFEDYAGTAYPTANRVSHGHLRVGATNAATVTSTDAHTGKHALHIQGTTEFDLDKGVSLEATSKAYYISVWVKQLSGTPALSVVDQSGTAVAQVSYNPNITNIEGWQQLRLKFNSNSNIATHKLRIDGGNCYVDDMRVQPFSSSMKTFVYDKDFMRLMAQLDENNYATIYTYDNEGNLLQVKQETERGIMTVKSGRKTTRLK